MKLYDSLICQKKDDAETWIGNNRWFVKVSPQKQCFRFCTAPVNRNAGDCINGGYVLNKTLIELKTDSSDNAYTYGVDYFENTAMRIDIPFGVYGALIDSSIPFSFHAQNGDTIGIAGKNNAVCIQDGIYFIALFTDGVITLSDDDILLTGRDGTKYHTAMIYGVERESVIFAASDLLKKSAENREESRAFWENYLASCPVCDTAVDDLHPEKLLLRQYWAWWCLLINVSDVDFNDFPVYMSPEKVGWLGTWSNDGPECMAALSLTNQKETARRLICSHIDASIDEDGRYAWYTHADGQRCYGRNGDPGRLSNGAPCIVHTVGFYIRNTGDVKILKECLPSGKTVYEKLKKYISVIWRDRDINGDLLIEWSNLWESGWDDKLGCFFDKAPIGEWWASIEKNSNEEFDEFARNNRCPVTTIVEQVYLLWALSEMAEMAETSNDNDFAVFCRGRYIAMIEAVEKKCWSDSDSFYHDIDVNNNRQIPAKSTDAFYFLYFVKDAARRKKMLQHLLEPREFNLMYIPMQSADVEGFSPTGYWSGGHWPREMSYLSLALNRAGFTEQAKSIVCKAINSGEGNTFYEVLNPYTGEPTTSITHMAYDILDVVALLAIDEQIMWTAEQ